MGALETGKGKYSTALRVSTKDTQIYKATRTDIPYRAKNCFHLQHMDHKHPDASKWPSLLLSLMS